MNSKISDYLDELFSSPKCELEYSKDYELLIAIVLSARTTDKGVNKVTKTLFSKYPTLDLLSKAKIEDIEIIIKDIGTYHKKAMFIHDIASTLIKDDYKKVPNDRSYLENLSGVGRKTTNVFLGEIYNVPTLAVDTHVNRVSNRLGLVNTNDVLKIEQRLMKLIPEELWVKRHKQLVLFGRYHCMAIKPKCHNCKLTDICKYHNIKK